MESCKTGRNVAHDSKVQPSAKIQTNENLVTVSNWPEAACGTILLTKMTKMKNQPSYRNNMSIKYLHNPQRFSVKDRLGYLDNNNSEVSIGSRVLTSQSIKSLWPSMWEVKTSKWDHGAWVSACGFSWKHTLTWIHFSHSCRAARRDIFILFSFFNGAHKKRCWSP